ncbi:MAG: hypothetical protein RR303_03885 [Bacteroidales bacterium]
MEWQNHRVVRLEVTSTLGGVCTIKSAYSLKASNNSNLKTATQK